jgi:hypothetical protein
MRLCVERPCDADWEQMPGSDARRFCCRCGKDVYDLSAISERQAARLVARGGLCARFVAVGAVLFAGGAVHADLAARPAKKAAKRPSPDELIEHVPHAPEDRVMGDVSLSAIKLPVKKIQQCYQKRLEQRKLAGRLVLKLVISGGRVAKVDIGESDLGDAELEKCIVDEARSWRFPEDAETITISYPFIFRPAL